MQSSSHSCALGCACGLPQPTDYIVTPPGRRPAHVQAFIDHLAGNFVLEPWAKEGWGVVGEEEGDGAG